LILKIVFDQFFSPINFKFLAEFVEFIELDKGHAQSIKSVFKLIFFPILKLNLELVLDELEKIPIREFILL